MTTRLLVGDDNRVQAHPLMEWEGVRSLGNSVWVDLTGASTEDVLAAGQALGLHDRALEAVLGVKQIRHFAFSIGETHCPGAGLSRLEQNITWHAILDRLDDLAFAEGKNDFTHTVNFTMRSFQELHITFRALC